MLALSTRDEAAGLYPIYVDPVDGWMLFLVFVEEYGGSDDDGAASQHYGCSISG